jgi:hypothetical protein
MSTLIQIDHVPPADLVDFLREVMAKTWVPMECLPESRLGNFRGEFRASGLGPMQVVVIDVPPATVSRTPAHISHADPDMLKLVLAHGITTEDAAAATLAAFGDDAAQFADSPMTWPLMIGAWKRKELA